MGKSEKEFEKIAREHKNTIYTVCFMFSKDNDVVAQKCPSIHIHEIEGRFYIHHFLFPHIKPTIIVIKIYL